MAPYDFNLVFEGGGAKGLVFVGAMQEFEAQGYTFGRLLGTSAGAITATLLAAGFDSTELLEAVSEKLPNGKSRFSSFMDIPEKFEQNDIHSSLTYMIFQEIDLPFISDRVEKKIDEKIFQLLMNSPVYRQVFSFIERGGLYAGDAFSLWLTEKLNKKGRDLGSTTLAEFNERTNRSLTVVASDTSAEKILVLNHRTAPNCPVVAAVRMSMSIPFLWQEVSWLPKWGHYRSKDISGHIIVDGGVLSNFPINLLISKDKEVIQLMGKHDGAFAVGLLIDEMLPVQGLAQLIANPVDGDNAPRFPLDIKKSATLKRITNLVNTMTSGHDKLVIEAYTDGVCRLPAKGYGTTDFDLPEERSQVLISAGKSAMNQFLKTLLPYLKEHFPEKLRKET